MLFKGYSEAIKSIRLRKGLTQKQCAERARKMTGTLFDEKTWSKYETGTTSLGEAALHYVTAGLKVTETELWLETLTQQILHYCGLKNQAHGNLLDVEPPIGAAVVQGLWALPIERLPGEERRYMEDQRRALAMLLTTAFDMAVKLAVKWLSRVSETATARQENDVENDL